MEKYDYRMGPGVMKDRALIFTDDIYSVPVRVNLQPGNVQLCQQLNISFYVISGNHNTR